MIYLFFFLKFKTQLLRTRPEIVRKNDELLIRMITDAGGKITGEKSVISAVFNSDKIGFWLDMFFMFKKLKKNMDASKDFFGFSLVLSNKLPESPELLCRFLSNHNGIFIRENPAKKFEPYAVLEKSSHWLKGVKKPKYGSSSYLKVMEFKGFKKVLKSELDFKDDVISALEQGDGEPALFLGPPHTQIRAGLYEYCGKLNGDFPALTISFGSIGIGAIIDAWSLKIRSLSGNPAERQDLERDSSSMEEIEYLWDFLFRERLRDEISDYVVRCAKRFLFLVYTFYINAAHSRNCTPVIIFENIHLSSNVIAKILFDTLSEIDQEKKVKILRFGTGETDILQDKLRQWELMFANVIKFDRKQNEVVFPKLSAELWEIVYALSLLSRYFSPELFVRFFEEDDINPAMITNAFSILHDCGIIDNPHELQPVNRHFEKHARKVLDGREEKVKKMICQRLISWASKRNINPCFRLLSIVNDLNSEYRVDDLLLLQSVSFDIINETISGIENAMTNGQFDKLFAEKTMIMQYLFFSSRALHSGDERDIENAFSGPALDSWNADIDPHSIYKMKMLVNLGAHYLGRNNRDEAAKRSKEAILLGQDKNSYYLPQAYRIFSLVCLSKQQVSESIEYLSFALANAEKSGNYHELSATAYYSAVAQFLYGDIYNASKFAAKSIEHALSAGRPEWADKSRFLEGRLEFELGRYREAQEIFEALRKEPHGSMTEEKDGLFAAWIYRCKIYLKDTLVSKPEPANHDADMFEIEAEYLYGNYEKAVENAHLLTNPFFKDNYTFTEQVDWSSGFAQCEQLYFTHGEIQDRIKNLFYSLSLSRLSSNSGEEAIKVIQKILQDEKLCEMDPWDAVYFFAKYSIFMNTGANPVDLSTSVSIAFKRLQRRAGRIGNVETRRQYLNGSCWNRELGIAAREFKLI